MAYSITQFANQTSPHLADLDNTIATVSAAGPINCSITGTNALTLTPNAAGLIPSAAISAYANDMLFVGVASASNTGNVTAQVGSLASLNVYKNTPFGPALVQGKEIFANNAISLLYSSALNSGAGGFYLTTTTAVQNTLISPAAVQINGNATITNMTSGNTPVLTFTATPGWSSQDQTFTVVNISGIVPTPNDFVQVLPPSLAAVGVVFSAQVLSTGSLTSLTSAATINVRLLNAASASLASNSGIYRYVAMKMVP